MIIGFSKLFQMIHSVPSWLIYQTSESSFPIFIPHAAAAQAAVPQALVSPTPLSKTRRFSCFLDTSSIKLTFAPLENFYDHISLFQFHRLGSFADSQLQQQREDFYDTTGIIGKEILLSFMSKR